MGFKIKTLGQAFRPFTAGLSIGPLDLTAGVPIAELYFGWHGRVTLAAGAPMPLTTILATMSEFTLTYGGEAVISIENGNDLLALVLAPWFDHLPEFTSEISSAHYGFVKGLTLPLSLPSVAAGEAQIFVENTTNANISGEYLSIAEGQGFYAQNVFSVSGSMIAGKGFHIVKRLRDPTAAGWGEGMSIGFEGDLVGLLIYQTVTQDQLIEKDAITIRQLRLQIGGETVIESTSLNSQGRHGARGVPDSHGMSGGDENLQEVLDHYMYFDFARQPWDCRGKSVILSWEAGTSHEAVRAYPIYMWNWPPSD